MAADRHTEFYNNPPPSNAQEPMEFKVPNKIEYIAHQAFYIRRALERIADALEKKSG